MTLLKSAEYGWRLDSDEEEYYYPESQVFYHAFVGNKEKFDTIFSGTAPILRKDKKILLKRAGVVYEEIQPAMSIQDMKSFITEMMQEELAEKYIQQYIDGVYYEKKGRLYRAVSAPKKVLPDFGEDYFAKGNYTLSGWMGGMAIHADLSFHNPQSGKEEIQPCIVQMNFQEGWDINTITDISILTELPLVDVQ